MAPGRLFRSSPSAWRSRVIRFDLAGSARREQFQAAARAPSGRPLPDPSLSYAVGNRGASEWHFTINFQTKLAALTVLDTPNVCTDEYPSPAPGVKIKVCPMRLAMFEADRYALVIDGAACFLEKQPDAPIEDSSATRTEVSYDVTARAFKIRYTVSHMEIPQCAQTVPLHPAN